MRISTSQIYDSAVRSMQRANSAVKHSQNQIAADRRILTSSDDPVASAQVLNVCNRDRSTSSIRPTAERRFAVKVGRESVDVGDRCTAERPYEHRPGWQRGVDDQQRPRGDRQADRIQLGRAAGDRQHRQWPGRVPVLGLPGRHASLRGRRFRSNHTAVDAGSRSSTTATTATAHCRCRRRARWRSR